MKQPNPYESPKATQIDIDVAQGDRLATRVYRFAKVAVLAGVPFGFFMGVWSHPGPPLGLPGFLIIALPSGVMFGVMLAAFIESQRSRFTHEDPCLEEERVLKQGPANHLCGWEARGGWLYLTDRRLLFRSHGYNIQNQELSIPIEAVVDAQPCATFCLIPNGLRVLTQHSVQRFVVSRRRSWAAAITATLENQTSAH
jgi:hypothetical protein